jgi:diguanylate cyclase
LRRPAVEIAGIVLFDAPPMTPDLQPRVLQALAGSAGGMALFDDQDRLRWANDWFREAYGLAPDAAPTWEEMLRRCHAEGVGVLIEDSDFDGWIAAVRRKYRRSPVRSFESDLVDGRWLWVTESVGADGWVTTHCTDISALKQHEATLRRARDQALLTTRIDALTGVNNRRTILRRLHDELEHAHAMRLPLCVAVMDVDHFRRINDFHGHDAGDRVLASFARTLKRHRRRVDVIGRLGGGEFMLMLPNATLEGARSTLLRLREDVEASLATVRRGELPTEPYDFSTGITQARYGDTVDSLVRRADQALEDAKADGGGRDGVRVPEADNTFGWSASTQSAMLAR